MSIRNLRSLIAIARHGSFAKAAEHLGLTQAAISLQMKQIEDELRLSLFDRSHRSPRLNEAGLIVLQRAEKIVSLYDDLGIDLAADSALTGTLSLGTIQTAQSGLLPGALAAFQAAHPAVQIRIYCGLSAGLALKVEQGDLDAALITEPVTATPERLEFHTLAYETFHVVAPLEDRGIPARELLEQRPFIRFDRNAWAGRQIDRRLREEGIKVRDAMELDYLSGIQSMVAAGLGVTIIPLNAARRAAAEEICWVTPFGSPPLRRGLGLIERRDHRRRRLTDALRPHLAAAATDDPQ